MSRQFTRDYDNELALGNITGHSIIESRGSVIGINQDLLIDIWDYAATQNIRKVLTGATTLYVSSDNAADINNTILIVGLDGVTQLSVLQVVNTNGQNQVAIPGTWYRFFSATNISAPGKEMLGNLYIAESDTLTGGVPNTASKVQGFMVQGNERTFNGDVTIPKDHIGLVRKFIESTPRGIDSDIRTSARPNGGVLVLGAIANLFESLIDVEVRPPQNIPALTDLNVGAQTKNNNTDIFTTLTIELVEQ